VHESRNDGHEEVATRLSVSIRTVERLVASGELRGVRVRRSVRVTPEALDAYISSLPCQSANAQIASKSVSASAVVGASNGRSRPAPGAPTRSRSKLLCVVPSSIRS
jgi:excisionase family DNA binding protein